MHLKLNIDVSKIGDTFLNKINQENAQSSSLVSRNITVTGKRTSVRLEPEMWAAIKDIADREECTIHDVCTLIALRKKQNSSLTAAIRVFIMLYFKAACTEEGHARVNHGNFKNMMRRARIDEKDMAYFSSSPAKASETTKAKSVGLFEVTEKIAASGKG